MSEVHRVFSLESLDLVRPRFEREADDTLTVTLDIEGAPRKVLLRPHSVRSPDLLVEAQMADGSFVPVQIAPARTYRGRIVGDEESVVAASWLDDGLHALILHPQRPRQWIEPIGGKVAGAHVLDHAVYKDADVAARGGTCGVMAGVAGPAPKIAPAAINVESASLWQEYSGEPNDTWFAEIALDADVEYFLDYGTVAATVEQMETIINIVNIQYERDVGIQHVIAHVIVRTADPDPYSSNDASTLLDQFRNHWFAAQGGRARDVAQLFTGKNLFGEIIGLAYFTGICSDLEGYSIVESNSPLCGSLACKTDLSAHELGHNWGAGHCACSGWTMNSVIQGANRFHPVETIPEIIAYRDTRDCLFQGDVLSGVEIVPDSDTVAAGNATQLQATALFQFGIDKDVTTKVTWSVEPPGVGTVDAAGVFAASPEAGSTIATVSAAYTFDGVTEVGETPITIVERLAAPAPDPVEPDKNRFISFVAPLAAGESAVRVTLLSLHHPLPENHPDSPAPDFSSFEGGVRWVGALGNCPRHDGTLATFPCATLQCTPHYETDWGVDVIHVSAMEIIPSSMYEIHVIPAQCRGVEDQCSLTSHGLTVATQRYGDVAPSFQEPAGPPGSASQPNVIDVSVLVDRLKLLPGAPSKVRSKFWPTFIDPMSPVVVTDLAVVVEAVKGAAYPPDGPCPCPSLFVCPNLDPCKRCRTSP